jgi:hypothetical protein
MISEIAEVFFWIRDTCVHGSPCPAPSPPCRVQRLRRRVRPNPAGRSAPRPSHHSTCVFKARLLQKRRQLQKICQRILNLYMGQSDAALSQRLVALQGVGWRRSRATRGFDRPVNPRYQLRNSGS